MYTALTAKQAGIPKPTRGAARPPAFIVIGNKAIALSKVTAAFLTTVNTRTNIGWAEAPKLTLVVAGMPAGDRTVTCYGADAARAWKIIQAHKAGICR